MKTILVALMVIASPLIPGHKSGHGSSGNRWADYYIRLHYAYETMHFTGKSSNATSLPGRAWGRCQWDFGHGVIKYKNFNGPTVIKIGALSSTKQCGKRTLGLETVGGELYQYGLQVHWDLRDKWKTIIVFTRGAH